MRCRDILATYVVLGDDREELVECLGKVGTKRVGQGAHKFTSRHNEDGIIFSLIFKDFGILILIRVLLA
jgi:hypothetical protein